jgi:hypothetical protein
MTDKLIYWGEEMKTNKQLLEEAVPITVFVHPVIHKVIASEGASLGISTEAYASWVLNSVLVKYVYLKSLKVEIQYLMDALSGMEEESGTEENE